jgi:hypothetical protein
VQNFDIDTMGEYCQDAIDQLGYGDAWFIEVGVNNLPLEGVQACYDVIWTGVFARGISCVEAAGNGHLNLDDPVYEGRFNRNVRDSGAILVAAGTPDGLVAEDFTNYGSRVDVHGWGEDIVTAGYGDLYNGGSPETRYTAVFGGTSGATGMLAGAVVSLLGISRAAFGTPVDPDRLRAVLHDTGTPHQGDREIGTRPNLVLAAPALLDLTNAPDRTERPRLQVTATPNPFRSRTEFRIEAIDRGEGGEPGVSIFDAAGRKVRGLRLSAGIGGGRNGGSPDRSRLVWDGTDGAGRPVASGVYFYRVDQAGTRIAGRVEVIR